MKNPMGTCWPIEEGRERRMDVLQPTRERSATLVDLIDRILDKGVVINADIVVSLAGVELLGIKIRAALASIETAAMYGLEFPTGTSYETSAWKEAQKDKETCSQCYKRVERDELLHIGCPWCGWRSALAKGELPGSVKVPIAKRRRKSQLIEEEIAATA
jgi:DNA-directed RNA polymerase subunit RPC12/RpoP